MKRCDWVLQSPIRSPWISSNRRAVTLFPRRTKRWERILFSHLWHLSAWTLEVGNGWAPFRRKRWKELTSPLAGASRCSSCVHLPLLSVLDPKMWIAGKLGLRNLLNFLFPMIRFLWPMKMKWLSRWLLLSLLIRLGVSLQRCWSIGYCLIILIKDLFYFVKISWDGDLVSG